MWRRYRDTGDAQAREELLRISLRFVYQAAHTLLRSKKRCLPFEDLLSAGTIGLVEALERFDPEAGVSFHYFAAQRIRGAMLDALRKEQRLTRTLARKRDRVRRERARLAQLRGHPPRESEVADALQIPLSDYWRLMRTLNRTTTLELHPGVEEDVVPAPQSRFEGPFENLLRKERRQRVRFALQGLPERERLVLQLSFFDGLLLREIGRRLGVGEARACQLRQRALRRLKSKLAGSLEESSGDDRMAA